MSTPFINRRKTHCDDGHLLSGTNLSISKQGYRICRECKRLWRERLAQRQCNVVVAFKVCYQCNASKPLSAFNRHAQSPLGHWNVCKVCRRQQNQEWYKNRGGKETVRRNVKAWRKRTGYPGWSDAQHEHARNLAQAALRRGKLRRQPCEICGDTRSQMHHPDYAKPLEVKFLCQRHHKEADLTIEKRGSQ